MKKTLILILLFAYSSFTYAQMWKEDFYKTSSQKESKNFYEIQNDFYNYWESYGVSKGFYLENGKKRKAAGWKQFKRWEWYWETRINRKTGEFPDINLLKIQNDYLKGKNMKADLADWQSMGPNSSDGGYAGIGRINCITFHPSNNDIFWIGAPSGGLWKTTDGGSSWDILMDDLPVIGVSAVVLANDYETSNTMYIATGDRDGGDNYSIGILKSTDNGVNWNITGFDLNVSWRYRITRLLMDPSNSDIMYVSTNGGLYKTTDGWNNFNSNLTSTIFFDMEFKPGSEDAVLYAASAGYNDNAKVYKTINAGVTWSSVYTFPSSVYRVELDVSEANPDIVYALASTSEGGLEGVYKSTDSGNSFTKVYDGTITGNNLLNWHEQVDDPETSGQGHYDLTISVSPIDENIIYLGGINTWKSTDGGVNWSVANHWYSSSYYESQDFPEVHADKHYMEYQNSSTFFEANDGGIYKTTDGGVTWTDLTNDMVISQMYKLGVSQTVQGEVITGLQDNGSKLVSSDTWRDVKGGDGMECIIDYTDVNVQYATYTNGQIDRTVDHWSNWQTVVDITANMPEGEEENGAWVTPYILDPNNSTTIYLGYEDVWKSTDRGDNWTQISSLALTNKIRAMAIASSDNNTLYITDHNKLYKTTNGGSSWTNITSSLPSNPESNSLNSITIDDNDPSKLWICFGGYDNVKIFESADGGSSWTDISAGLPSVPANTLVNYKHGETQQLYAGTDMGVYYKNGTNDWELFSNGLPSVIVTELEIYYDDTTPENTTLYASTYGRGLWETSLASINSGPTVEITSSESGTTTNSPFDIVITFSEEVNGFEQGDINVTNGTVTDFDGTSNPTFNVEITPTADGQVTVTVESGVAQDTDGYDNSSDQWSINYSSANSIVDLENLGVKIYPNPFNGNVKLEFTEAFHSMHVEVYDIQGKVVYKNNLEYDSVKELDLNHLANGVYFLNLNMDSKIVQTKIIKK